MLRTMVMAAALAGGVFLVPAVHSPAEAAVVGANAGLDKPSGITMVRRGGGGGGHHGGRGHGGFGKSFGGKSFVGGHRGFKSFGGHRGFKSFGGHRVGHKHFRGHRGFHKGHFRHRHRHGKKFLFIGAPFYGYYYDGYYGDDCYWLRRRAIRTGSAYWWSRYYACIGY